MAQISLSTVPGKIVLPDGNDNTVKFPVDLFPARQVKFKIAVGTAVKFSLGQAVDDAESLSYVAGDDLILTITPSEGYLHVKGALNDEIEVEV